MQSPRTGKLPAGGGVGEGEREGADEIGLPGGEASQAGESLQVAGGFHNPTVEERLERGQTDEA